MLTEQDHLLKDLTFKLGIAQVTVVMKDGVAIACHALMYDDFLLDQVFCNEHFNVFCFWVLKWDYGLGACFCKTFIGVRFVDVEGN